MEGVQVEQQPDGKWLAKSAIGSMFGFEVDGECRGEGATKEEALANLKKDIANLGDSMWA